MKNTLVTFFAGWGFLLGSFFIVTYFMYNRSKFFTAFGDFVINCSFSKRTEKIILSYGILILVISVLLLVMAQLSAHYGVE